LGLTAACLKHTTLIKKLEGGLVVLESGTLCTEA